MMGRVDHSSCIRVMRFASISVLVNDDHLEADVSYGDCDVP